MSKRDKLIKRFLSIPKDLTWDELIQVLAFYGYIEIKTGKTSGSGKRFADETKNVIAFLHKPHPANIVKIYMIKLLIEELKLKGKIKDE